MGQIRDPEKIYPDPSTWVIISYIVTLDKYCIDLRYADAATNLRR